MCARLSIIMPVYNAEEYLKRSIDSVIKQSCVDWELIVIDDGSTDNSLEILRDYEKKHENIKVIHQDNQGPGLTRNNGVKCALGEYVSFIDADDYVDEDYVKILLNAVSNFNADVVFFDSVQEHPDGTVIKVLSKDIFSNVEKEDLIKCQLSAKIEWGMCNKVIKRSIITTHGLFCSEDPVGEEAVFSFELLRQVDKIKFVDKILYHYVYYPTGQHSKGNEDPWKNVCLKMKQHLLNNKIYNRYETSLNCLAFKALSICLYRISNLQDKEKKLKLMKEKSKWYKNNFSFNSKKIDKTALDTTSRLLLPFVRINLMFPILIMSKLRSLIMKRK